jgi:5-methylcytosine-specific restriction protein A
MAKAWRDMTRAERDGRGSAKWKRTRQAVFAQYGDTCWLCGRPGADTVDHLEQLADGGHNDLGNLRPAHGKRQPWGCPGNFGRKGRAPLPQTSRDW